MSFTYSMSFLEGKVSESWTKRVVMLFYKKGDKALLKNYKSNSLLTREYNLFSRVITNWLTRKLDDFQPPEQADFRKGYSTIDTSPRFGRFSRRLRNTVSVYSVLRKPLIQFKVWGCSTPTVGRHWAVIMMMMNNSHPSARRHLLLSKGLPTRMPLRRVLFHLH